MTDNEIIKALECCTSDKCTCSECSYEYTKHIKNEEFEVMSNGKSYDEWSCDEWLKCDLLDLINRQKAEIERLEERADRHLYNLKAVLDARRADTRRIIEEFADIIVENYPEMEYFINNLVKEFTEE